MLWMSYGQSTRELSPGPNFYDYGPPCEATTFRAFFQKL